MARLFENSNVVNRFKITRKIIITVFFTLKFDNMELSIYLNICGFGFILLRLRPLVT